MLIRIRLQDDSLQVSFHLPLHRYLAVFLCQAVAKQNISLNEVLPPSDTLHLLMMHPLRVQVSAFNLPLSLTTSLKSFMWSFFYFWKKEWCNDVTHLYCSSIAKLTLHTFRYIQLNYFCILNLILKIRYKIPKKIGTTRARYTCKI